MGNAIALLALAAGFEVVGHVPVPEFAANAPGRMRQKYEPLLKRGRIDAAAADAEVASVTVATDLAALADCDLVIEARKEDPDAKADVLPRARARSCGPTRSSARTAARWVRAFSATYFAAGGGDAAQLREPALLQPGRASAARARRGRAHARRRRPRCWRALHGFVRKIGKVPVILQDGSPGFLVNAGARRVLPRGRGALSRGHADRAHRPGRCASASSRSGPFERRRPGGRRRRRGHVRRDRADRAAADRRRS